MVRTIISLDERDKEWLDRKAADEGVPMTELIRRAVKLLRKRMQASELTTSELLDATRNTWNGEEGLVHQDRLRDEW